MGRLFRGTDLTRKPPLTQPLLLVWAEHDQFQPLATARRFAEEYPQAELKIIPGSDHFLPLERPDEVSNTLLEFFG